MKYIKKSAAAVATAASLFAMPVSAETEVPLATWGSPTHVGVRQFVPALEEAISQAQPNDLKLVHFAGGQLANDKDMPVGLPSGQVKIGWTTINGWSGIVADTRITDAPTGLTMIDLDTLVDRDGGVADIWAKGFAEKNAVLLGLADLGPVALVSNGKVMVPSDLKGKRVRVFSEGQAETIAAFGGSPVTIPFAEVYSAMQYGTIDAAVIGFQGVGSQKMDEVADHVMVAASFLGTTMMGWAANRQWFDSLSPENQTALTDAMDVASHSNREAIRAEIDDLVKEYQTRGMTVTLLDPSMAEFETWKLETAPLLEAALEKVSPELAELFGQ